MKLSKYFLFRERDIAYTEKSKDGMIGVRKRNKKKED